MTVLDVPTNVEITDASVNAAFDAVLAKYGPNYTSTPNTYTMGVGPNCIVGQVLDFLGAPFDALRRMDAIDARIGGQRAADILAGHGMNLTTMAAALLAMAQQLQDGGVPWGDVVSQSRFTFYGIR